MQRRVLLLSPVPTHPQTAGNRTRISSLLQTLLELHYDVTFLHARQEPGDDEAMRQTWGNAYQWVEYVWPAERFATRLKRKLFGRVNADAKYTLHIDEWYDPALDDQVRQLHRAQPFHAVVASYVFFSRALLNFGPEVTRIIDTHDAFANRHRQYLEHGETPKWYSTTEAGERTALNRADLVFAIQDRERTEFSKLTRTPVVTLGHITPIDPLLSTTTNRILFVASDNGINVHGIRHFIDTIFPAIRQAIPGAVLVVAGSVCRSLADGDGIELLGRVEDLRATYMDSSVVINPVQFKTGVAIKNLEALGYGKPLVTALIGSEGMEAGRGVAYLAAGSDEEFASQVAAILKNPAYAAELSAAALTYISNCNQAIRDELVRAIGPPQLA
mgnify:CR=1 FL=1